MLLLDFCTQDVPDPLFDRQRLFQEERVIHLKERRTEPQLFLDFRPELLRLGDIGFLEAIEVAVKLPCFFQGLKEFLFVLLHPFPAQVAIIAPIDGLIKSQHADDVQLYLYSQSGDGQQGGTPELTYLLAQLPVQQIA